MHDSSVCACITQNEGKRSRAQDKSNIFRNIRSLMYKNWSVVFSTTFVLSCISSWISLAREIFILWISLLNYSKLRSNCKLMIYLSILWCLSFLSFSCIMKFFSQLYNILCLYKFSYKNGILIYLMFLKLILCKKW